MRACACVLLCQNACAEDATLRHVLKVPLLNLRMDTCAPLGIYAVWNQRFGASCRSHLQGSSSICIEDNSKLLLSFIVDHGVVMS